MTQKIETDLWDEFESELKKTGNIQINFPQNTTAIESEGVKTFFEKFLSERFPEGSVNTTLEKNFAVYIVQNKLDIQAIKQKYRAQGWKVEGLLGWIKKVVAGEINQLNIGELVLWCKTNRPDLIELFTDLNKIDETQVIRRADLKLETSHLPFFYELDACTKIVGTEYKHLKKILWYHLVSGCVPESLLNVKVGQIEIDLRDYSFLVYPTGASKGNVKYFIMQTKRDLFQQAISLASYHEEQLIGRVVNRGTKKKPDWVKNEGHFKADELLFDETKSLLMDKEKETSRNFLLQGMDKYKQNIMYKRLTENLNNPDEVLSYYPKFDAIFFTQPFQFPEDKLVLNGFLKRVTTDYLPQVERPDNYFDERLDDKRPTDDFYHTIIINLEKIRDFQRDFGSNWSFTENFNDTFKECYRLLRHAGLYNSRKKRNYTRLVEWQLQDRLLRKSCLLALGRDHTICVRPEHVELAFLDLLEDFVIELEFVNDKIYGDLDYGSVWGTTNMKEKDLLIFLSKAGAVSEETSIISIKEFHDQIGEKYKVKLEQQRKIYYRMIENGLIQSRNKTKEHDSRVWLANPPQDRTSGTTGISGNEVKRKYFELVAKYFGGGTSGTALGGKNYHK